MTQEQRVLKYIQDFGSITSLEAFQELGCTRLSAKIFNLKKKGYNFNKRTVKSQNRWGEPTHFAEYSLKEKENESISSL